MKLTPIAIGLLLTATTLVAEPEIKGTATELAQHLANVPRLVTLAGEAELKVPADRAVVSLKVVTENKSLQEASRLNQELRGKLIKSLTDRGVPGDRVQSSKFSSTPKYGVFGEKAKSYRVENVVKVKTQDEKEFQAVAAIVDSQPEVRYDQIEFEHSDKSGLKKTVLGQAIDKVSEKKAMYEQKLGVKLTPKGFSEGIVTPAPMEMALRNTYTSLPARSGSSPAFEGDGESAPTSFGELVFVGRVTVDYAVESK